MWEKILKKRNKGGNVLNIAVDYILNSKQVHVSPAKFCTCIFGQKVENTTFFTKNLIPCWMVVSFLPADILISSLPEQLDAD